MAVRQCGVSAGAMEPHSVKLELQRRVDCRLGASLRIACLGRSVAEARSRWCRCRACAECGWRAPALALHSDTDHEATSFGLIRSADSHRTRRRDRHRPAPRRAAGQPARTTRIPTPRRDRAVSRRANHKPIRLGASGSSTGPRPRCRPRTTGLLSGGYVLSLRSLVDGPPYRGTEVKIRLVRSEDF
jgi:hypothetical protein